MPHVFSFGLAAFPMEGLTVGIAVDVTTWSSYEELRVDFIDDEGNVNEELSSGEPKSWENTFTIRLGAEYRLLDGRLPVRIGFFYDQSPVPDTTVAPELPDADRYAVSIGAGYKHGEFTADLAYLFLMTGDNETAETAPLVGTYRAHAHLLGLTLGYRLDI
jgi:long-chain fatty acid transport protein